MRSASFFTLPIAISFMVSFTCLMLKRYREQLRPHSLLEFAVELRLHGIVGIANVLATTRIVMTTNTSGIIGATSPPRLQRATISDT